MRESQTALAAFVLYFQLGDVDAAIETIERALALDDAASYLEHLHEQRERFRKALVNSES